jgi:hypothetical protein
LLPSPLLRPCKRAHLSLLAELAEVVASFWRVFRRLSFLAIVADQARFAA